MNQRTNSNTSIHAIQAMDGKLQEIVWDKVIEKYPSSKREVIHGEYSMNLSTEAMDYFKLIYFQEFDKLMEIHKHTVKDK